MSYFSHPMRSVAILANREMPANSKTSNERVFWRLPTAEVNCSPTGWTSKFRHVQLTPTASSARRGRRSERVRWIRGYRECMDFSAEIRKFAYFAVRSEQGSGCAGNRRVRIKKLSASVEKLSLNPSRTHVPWDIRSRTKNPRARSIKISALKSTGFKSLVSSMARRSEEM